MRSFTYQITKYALTAVSIIDIMGIGDVEKGVKYISVNNAVLLCEDCAAQHKKLHSGISYVMSIADAGDTYSLQKVELLKFGGNDRFK